MVRFTGEDEVAYDVRRRRGMSPGSSAGSWVDGGDDRRGRGPGFCQVHEDRTPEAQLRLARLECAAACDRQAGQRLPVLKPKGLRSGRW